MLSCFGVKSKTGKKETNRKEIDSQEMILKNLKLDLNDIRIETENYKIQAYLLDEILYEYKKCLNEIETEPQETVENLLLQENSNLTNSCENLKGDLDHLHINVIH